MYYFPGFITLLYMFVAIKKSELLEDEEPKPAIMNSVYINLCITEVLFFIGWAYNLLTNDSFSVTKLVLFYVMQDIYFYYMHRYVFHGPLWRLHQEHHNHLSSHAAWHEHFVEHIFLNLGSIIVPFWLFPNTSWVFFAIICQQVYTSVNGHTKSSPHSVHHGDSAKRFGTIYLVDRIKGTY